MAVADEIKKAIGAHGKWKLNLTRAINTGNSEHSVADTARHNMCEFGKWLHGPTIPADAKGAEYDEVASLHAEFHKIASKVLELGLDGQKEAANRMLGSDYAQASSKLAGSLMSWKRVA